MVPLATHWFPSTVCQMHPGTPAHTARRWDCKPLPTPPGQFVPPKAVGSTSFPKGNGPAEQTVSRSLVTVDFGKPYPINGLLGQQYRGTGLVVDAALGLVVVDRQTCPTFLGDAKVFLLHPTPDLRKKTPSKGGRERPGRCGVRYCAVDPVPPVAGNARE